ncbi:MAG: DUF6062 family protein [Ruminiclostridium sp.]
MRESILTIPVNEVFEPKEGCPICRMRDTVEQHICEYIMGAAMMEPDVRQETNELGFCHTHFEMLMQQNNRLSLALMLNSYLENARNNIFEKKSLFFSKNAKAKKSAEIESTCFVCSKVNWGIDHMLETVFTMYVKDPKFRNLFKAQEYICVPHYNMLNIKAAQKLQKGDLADFTKALDTLLEDYIKQLNSDVNDFCNSFDYRNAGKLHGPDMEHVRSSIERSVSFLTGRKPRVK